MTSETVDGALDLYLNPVWNNIGFVPPSPPKWYRTALPHVVKGVEGASTVFKVQNRTGSAAPVIVYFFDENGSIVYNDYATIPANASKPYNLAQLPSLDDGYAGSVIIATLGQPAVATAARTYVYSGTTITASSAYPGQDKFDSTLLAPALLKFSAGQTSELCIQNVTPAPQAVTVRYTDGLEAHASLNAYAAHCFKQRDEPHLAGWEGAAKISGSGSLAGVVNVIGENTSATAGRWSYPVPSLSTIDNIGYLPEVSKSFFGYNSRIYLYNPNGAAAQVAQTFTGTTCISSLIIPPGGSVALTPDCLPSGYNGISSFSSTQPLASVVSTTNSNSTPSTDRYSGYSAIVPGDPNTPPASDYALFPDVGPLDMLFPAQPYYFNTGVVDLWSRGLTGSKPGNPLTVAVIDTGVNQDHPDIKGNLVLGWDFVDNDGIAQDDDPKGHGTAVAGVIAAQINNSISSGMAYGVAGIGGGDASLGTPGLSIMPLRVAKTSEPADFPSCSVLAAAINYAVAHGAKVINLSLHHTQRCQNEDGNEYQAILDAANAGVAVVAGAGNDGVASYTYPASYGADGFGAPDPHLVVAVAGVTLANKKYPASNYGSWVDICAPYGSYVSLSGSDSFAAFDGTSFSTALVSGLIGVLMSNYGWSREKAIRIVLGSTNNIDSLNPQYAGKLGLGCINAGRASTMIHDMFLPIAVR